MERLGHKSLERALPNLSRCGQMTLRGRLDCKSPAARQKAEGIRLSQDLSAPRLCDFCDLNRVISETSNAMPHCGLSLQWTIAIDLRCRAAILEPKPLFLKDCLRFGSGDAKSLAIAVARFWSTKQRIQAFIIFCFEVSVRVCSSG